MTSRQAVIALSGYASITEANLVNYRGMGLESNGRGGWVRDGA